MITNRNFKKLLAYSVITSYLITPLSYATTAHESVLPTVQDLYLKSFDVKRQQEETLESLKAKKQKIALQVKTLNDYEKTELSFKVAELDTEQQPTHPTILDKTFLKKMELYFGGETNANHLFGFVDRTTTHVGKVALAAMLGQPIFNKQELMQRQAIVKELIENPELFEVIDGLILQIKDAESEALSYWDQENGVNTELFKKVYLPEWLNYFNKNAMVLGSLASLNNLATSIPFSLPIGPFLGGATIRYNAGPIDDLTDQTQSPESTFTKLKEAIKFGANLQWQAIKFFDPRLKALNEEQAQILLKHLEETSDLNIKKSIFWNLKWQTSNSQKTLGDLVKTFNIDPTLSTGQRVGIIAYIGFVVGSLGYGMYKLADDALMRKNIANHLQTKLIGLATCINNAQRLQVIISNHATLSQHSAPFNTNLLEKQTNFSSNAKKLIELLNSNTFKGNASFFSMTGRVLAAHQIMKEVKDELAPFFTTIGTLDAYLSIAKLYKEFENKRVGYCFAEFVESDKPFVEAQEFWNPFVDPNVVVTNSVAMGGEYQNNIVLTGPNTGGKSTIIKGIIINILLAQTFGIAPAKRLILTPFKVLNCYLNITDDIATGTSLFMAEVQRAKALLNALNSLARSEFGFTIMDEVFSGTSPKEGEEAAYQFTEKIGNYGNSLCLVATHFPKLTELDQNKQWVNKHVAVEKRENGTLHRPFKLNDGKTFQNIAMDLLKDEGIFSDLSDAHVAALG